MYNVKYKIDPSAPSHQQKKKIPAWNPFQW